MTPLSLEALPDEVKELVGAIRQVEVPEQGATSDVVILRGAHGDFVVKRATKPPFDQWLRRESEVLAALRRSHLPTPETYLYLESDHGEDERGSSGGSAAWLVMERLPGLPLGARLRDEDDRRVRRRLFAAFGQVLRAIHTEPPPEGIASEAPWLEAALERARWYLEHYEVDGTAELLERLLSNPPRKVPQSLIHGDFTLSNVLVVGERVTGVIDWCWGAVGDPRYDLALATAAEPEAFREAAELDAFYEGYGAPRLSREETEYFLGLYEFF